jgi:2-polyprenyl-3-methyl-5-hydroxy-6-metoxy-1,4-benzoquinol methylase
VASTPAVSPAPEFDRAGKEFWEGVWSHVDFPPAIDPASPSIWAHRDQVFDRCFRSNLPVAAAPQSLLELGCARSAWLPYFATEFNYRIAGLDYAEDGVRQTGARLRQSGLDADIRHGDLFDPPIDWIGAFDVVTWFGVAEHFENTADAVRAAAAYLKPGGILITEVPNMAGIVGLLQRWFNKPVYDIHVPLTRSQLATAHRDAGLQVIAAEYVVPTDFGIVELENVPPGRGRWLKEKALFVLRLVSGCIWWLDRRIGPLPTGRRTSGFVIVMARRPTAAV